MSTFHSTLALLGAHGGRSVTVSDSFSSSRARFFSRFEVLASHSSYFLAASLSACFRSSSSFFYWPERWAENNKLIQNKILKNIVQKFKTLSASQNLMLAHNLTTV